MCFLESPVQLKTEHNWNLYDSMVEVGDVRKSSQEVRLAVNNLYNTSSNQDMKTFVPIEGYGETINAALESEVL